jgi:S-formylglutathione hydrolase FrmB
VNWTARLAAVLLLGVVVPAAPAAPWDRGALDRVNRRLHGTVIDYTHNHGADRRIWSAALCKPRDLYVYLPPCFDPHLRYPILLWLHGFAQDEQSFLEVIPPLDEAIAAGKLPPMIIASPDGSLSGESSLLSAGSFFLNSRAGAFEDYLMHDVWGFLTSHYPIRPEREAHVLAGVSMGGGAAYNLAIKYRDCFKVVIGIFPPVNTRWVDCHCRYMGNFDPCCWGWRNHVGKGWEVVGRFYGVILIHLKQVVEPLYGLGPEALEGMSRENPIEMLDTFDVQPCQLAMYIAYGGLDQFNIDAQVESFLYRAREKGLCVAVGYDPRGKHDRPTARRLAPGVIDWLGPQLAPFGPVPCPAP